LPEKVGTVSVRMSNLISGFHHNQPNLICLLKINRPIGILQMTALHNRSHLWQQAKILLNHWRRKVGGKYCYFVLLLLHRDLCVIIKLLQTNSLC